MDRMRLGKASRALPPVQMAPNGPAPGRCLYQAVFATTLMQSRLSTQSCRQGLLAGARL